MSEVSKFSVVSNETKGVEPGGNPFPAMAGSCITPDKNEESLSHEVCSRSLKVHEKSLRVHEKDPPEVQRLAPKSKMVPST